MLDNRYIISNKTYSVSNKESKITTPSTSTNSHSTPTIAIVGGGPAGLMAAEMLSQTRFKVNVYDAMPSVGRKFLLAGKGGLNLTHSEALDKFVARYGTQRPNLQRLVESFDPIALCHWAKELGIDTFIGTSGRVFPMGMKSAPLLRAWLHRLRAANVKFHSRHTWQGWDADNKRLLHFQTPNGSQLVHADAVILALGGGSWKKLGSTGAWVSLLAEQGMTIEPLKPSNCGFNVNWSLYFRERATGQPIKSVQATLQTNDGRQFSQLGEFVITEQGVEGSLIYALSSLARDEIEQHQTAVVHIDLIPNRDEQWLLDRLAQPQGKQSFNNHLRKRLRLDNGKIALLRECLSPDDYHNAGKLVTAIKNLPIQLVSPRPLDEAISSAGGISFANLDNNLMLHKLPGVFCAGEMLDWEAPTGGYLLTACFATGRAAGQGAIDWLQAQQGFSV